MSAKARKSIVSVSLPSWEEDDAPVEFEIPRRGTMSTRKGDLTPMVDVTFLLLVFFMILAAVNVQKKLTVEKTDEDGDPTVVEVDLASVQIVVDNENNIFVEDVAVTGFDSVTKALGDAREELGDVRLTLLLDPDSIHDRRILVADAAATAGFSQIHSRITCNY